MRNEFNNRRELLRFCHLLYERGLLAAAEGNVSIRCGDVFLTTPSGRNKGLIEVDDLVEVDVNGRATGKGMKASSEFAMHLQVYRSRPEINAVIHCHPVYATVFACSAMNLNSCLLTEVAVCLGVVPTAELALPSTDQVPASILPWVEKTDCILLAHHGALAYGQSLEDAFNKMETLERYAQISYFSALWDQTKQIPEEKILELESLRAGYGLNNPIIPCSGRRKQKIEKEMEEIIKEAIRNELQNRG
jgi:L-fuculose-phosphate aldolase